MAIRLFTSGKGCCLLHFAVAQFGSGLVCKSNIQVSIRAYVK